jgi:glycosyltransferase involved in cell wall biosynthesis
MTVGFFTDEYLPRLNGAVISAVNYRKALQRLGHKVYVIAPSEPGYKDDDDLVIRVPSFEPKMLKYKTRQPVLYPGLAKKLAAKCKFDIVHSQTQFAMGVLAHETSKILKVPHVSTMHTIFAELVDQYPRDAYGVITIISLIYPLYFKSVPKYDWRVSEGFEVRQRLKDQAWSLGSIFLNNTHAVIAPSKHIADKLKHYGLKKPCHILPNGLDVSEFNQLAKKSLPKDIPKKQKDIWILAVGRLSPEKRQRALIEAMKHVTANDVRLLIVGAGVAEAELNQQVAELGLQNKVYMLGRRDPNEIPAIMANSDVFALASYRFDNQPMVILEALAAGLPIIYCDDALTEGLTTKNSILTHDPSAESIAKAIDVLVSNRKKRKDMGKASSELVAGFDITKLAEELVRIYGSVSKTAGS